MADVLKRVPVREQDPAVRAHNFDEVCLGYDKEEAMEEASRCLHCKNAKCVQGCPVSINIPDFVAAVKEGEGLYANRKDSCRKLYWSKPAFTIKGNHGNCAIHPHQNRTISVREMSRLQSFPDDFDFSHVAKQYQYLQVGNAVPPLMAKHIANKMLTLL